MGVDVGTSEPGARPAHKVSHVPSASPAHHPVPDVPAVPSEGPDPLDDALLRARGGDEAGFLILWRTLQPRLLRYLRVRCVDGGEDVAAETWLQVVRDLHKFTGNADKFRGWLFTLARNRSIDAARAQASRPALAVPDVSEIVLPDAAALAASAETQAMERLSTEAALDLVASLPDDQAEMVALRVVADLDVATVAEMVGKTPGAVRVAVHRGLRALAEHPNARREVT